MIRLKLIGFYKRYMQQSEDQVTETPRGNLYILLISAVYIFALISGMLSAFILAEFLSSWVLFSFELPSCVHCYFADDFYRKLSVFVMTFVIYLLGAQIAKNSVGQRVKMIYLFLAALTFIVGILWLILGILFTVGLGGVAEKMSVWWIVIVILFGVPVLFFVYYVAAMGDKKLFAEISKWILIVLVVLAVAWGYFLIGSPSYIKKMKMDLLRTADLEETERWARHFYAAKGRLPDSNDVANNILMSAGTGEAQEYTKIKDSVFKLCATFSESGFDGYRYFLLVRGERRRIQKPKWEHGPGRQCFEVNVLIPSPY